MQACSLSLFLFSVRRPGKSAIRFFRADNVFGEVSSFLRLTGFRRGIRFLRSDSSALRVPVCSLGDLQLFYCFFSSLMCFCFLVCLMVTLLVLAIRRRASGYALVVFCSCVFLCAGWEWKGAWQWDMGGRIGACVLPM